MKTWYQFIKENQEDKALSHGLLDRNQLPQIGADQEENFAKFLENKGISVQKKAVKAKDITPMQNHINEPKVEKLKKCIKDSKGHCLKKWNFFLSSDHRLLDGHHRWVAVHDHDPDHDFDCHVANTSFSELISAGHEFNNSNLESGNVSGQAGAAGTSE